MTEQMWEIYQAFNGKLVGTKEMKELVCESLTHLPKDMQSFVTKNCWFLSSIDEAWAFTFTGNDVKDQHLIFLSDDLLSQHVEQIRHSILHEVGHVMLKHRNSVLEKQSPEEITNQEAEADAFVEKYLQY